MQTFLIGTRGLGFKVVLFKDKRICLPQFLFKLYLLNPAVVQKKKKRLSSQHYVNSTVARTNSLMQEEPLLKPMQFIFQGMFTPSC